MSEKELLDQVFDELFPIMRSITGPGLEESFDIISKWMPLTMSKVPTGTKVFDWTVPPEWHFKSAILIGPDGKTICDADWNNLHVVNYSEPVDKTMSLEELLPHLHSIERLPDAIPYVTSYYARTWGFCISDNTKKQLQPGNYQVKIESSFIDGGVPYAEHVLPGVSKKEILLTSYLCHPSIANNELSGPLVLLALYLRIKKWKKRRFTYRFLLNPETIGSLCFLFNNAAHLKENLAGGLILTCLGGPVSSLQYKSSKKVDSLPNKVVSHHAKLNHLPINITPFSPLNGSDERQFCAPGFNLPMGQISRTKYGAYDGYHTSLDTKEFMGIDNLIESIDVIEAVIKDMEICGNPINKAPFGEPQLGKRGLYPNLNSNETRKLSGDDYLDGRTQLNQILTILNMADGNTDLFEIAEACDCSIAQIHQSINKLEEAQLITYNVKVPTL